MLEKEFTKELVEKFGSSGSDTGSVPVQIALLSERIKMLSEHMKTHKIDFSSRRGLLRLIARRKKLLLYLHKHDFENYTRLVKDLQLKG